MTLPEIAGRIRMACFASDILNTASSKYEMALKALAHGDTEKAQEHVTAGDKIVHEAATKLAEWDGGKCPS